jgi:tol-pal system-associated acyl-CoA thioesterase
MTDKKSFSLKQRVYYEDTDALGVVYNANYLRYMERARSEWLWSLGYCFEEFMKQGVAFAVHHASLDYRHPARLKDEILCTCSIGKFGRTSMTFDQSVINADNNDIVYCDGQIRVVCITPEGKPRALPQDLMENLT